MEAIVVKIGSSLGFKIPEPVIKDFNLKAGTKIDLNFVQNDKLVLRQKSKIREDWDTAFAQYALNGEDKLMLPDFFDSETDAFL